MKELGYKMKQKGRTVTVVFTKVPEYTDRKGTASHTLTTQTERPTSLHQDIDDPLETLDKGYVAIPMKEYENRENTIELESEEEAREWMINADALLKKYKAL
jgi:hypothetical protein